MNIDRMYIVHKDDVQIHDILVQVLCTRHHHRPRHHHHAVHQHPTPLKCKTADLNKSLDKNENAHIDLKCALYEDALNCRKTKNQVGCLLNPI